MEAATGAERVGEGAERIESADWLREFAERYLAAWNALDPDGVAACVTEDVIWRDPALEKPAHGPTEVADFVRDSARAFPDLSFTEQGDSAIAEDGRVAYAPWVMTGTNTGPIDPPGFAPTGKRIELEGIDVWQFRDGRIWRYRAVYDFTDVARQLGLMPPRGGFAEKAMVRAQRLRSRFSG
jgi:steroid delta-isomerase-like uncharacterized protein